MKIFHGESFARESKSTAGFSLIEFLVFISISGLMVTPFYTMLYKTSHLGTSQDRVHVIKSALAEYVRIYGHYPCPTPMNATPSATDYASNPTCSGLISDPTGFVYIGALPIDDLRTAAGCGPIPPTLPMSMQQVFRSKLYLISQIMGATPTTPGAGVENGTFGNARCPNGADMGDAYGHKYLYAVTKSLTTLTAAPTAGSIIIQDQNGHNLTKDPQDFVLVSFGKDGAGATNMDGSSGNVACGAGPGGSAAAEVKNCNNNAIFVNAPYSVAANSSYFDDTVTYSLAGDLTEIDYWNWQKGASSTTPDLAFNPNSRVIVGTGPTATMSPDDRLVVSGGDMGVNTTGVALTKSVTAKVSVTADKYCYKPRLTTNCP